MQAALEEILQKKALTSLFQPIINMRSGAIIGYEGLIRGPRDSLLYSPVTLFAEAKQNGRTYELERLCWELHIQHFRLLGLPGKLFLNSSPYLLRRDFNSDTNTSDLMELITNGEHQNIVIELTEGDATNDYQQLRRAAREYRDLGVQIAIDDLGDAFSSLILWSELRPDYVKIDRYFIQNISTDPLKQQFVRSICEIAQQAQTMVVAEGIETVAELTTLRRLGVPYGQGYLLGRPQERPPRELGEGFASIFKTPFGTSLARALMRADKPITVRKVLRKAPTVEDTIATKTVYDQFQKNDQLDTLVLLRDGLPIGLLRRDRLFDLLARPFHRELYGNRPCRDILEHAPLIVDQQVSLHEVSQLIAGGASHHMTDGFIITRDGAYLGVGSSLELMREVSQLQLRAARYANPLTQLPGNVPINEHIDMLLDSGEPFAVCYGDLDNFKPFNDLYGYRKGDDVIQITAKLFLEHVDPDLDFVGHVGGDDFIVVFRSSDWEARCNRIIESLPLALRNIYSPEHLLQGGYTTENRQQVKVFHPLITISLGVVQVDRVQLYSGSLIAELATAAKANAKKMASNSLYIDRQEQASEPTAGSASRS